MSKRNHPGIPGRGTPGRDLEQAADRQAETTGGINYPGTDVNRQTELDNMDREPHPDMDREPHPDETRPQEATQGDWASGDLGGGSSLSVGDFSPNGSGAVDPGPGAPPLDTGDLEAVFEDQDFPCEREEIVAGLEMRGDKPPIPGVDLPELVASLPGRRFLNLSELVAAVREELDRRAHPA